MARMMSMPYGIPVSRKQRLNITPRSFISIPRRSHCRVRLVSSAISLPSWAPPLGHLSSKSRMSARLLVVQRASPQIKCLPRLTLARNCTIDVPSLRWYSDVPLSRVNASTARTSYASRSIRYVLLPSSNSNLAADFSFLIPRVTRRSLKFAMRIPIPMEPRR